MYCDGSCANCWLEAVRKFEGRVIFLEPPITGEDMDIVGLIFLKLSVIRSPNTEFSTSLIASVIYCRS